MTNWTVKRVGEKWMAHGQRRESSDTVTMLTRQWREAYAFAYIAAYGTPTAFWALYNEVERKGSVPDYYMRGVGESVPRSCAMCASP